MIKRSLKNKYVVEICKQFCIYFHKFICFYLNFLPPVSGLVHFWKMCNNYSQTLGEVLDKY